MIAFSMTSREKLWGGVPPGAIAPGDDPGTVLARQVVDIGIGGECAQTLRRSRLEDIYAHGVALSERFWM